MITHRLMPFALALVAVGGVRTASGLEAYYAKVESTEEFERFSRTGPFADIVVEVNGGKLCFWRGASYLPYWETNRGRWPVEEIVARQGDGPKQRPDRVNTFSRVMLIDSRPDRAEIVWRYLPDFSGYQPSQGVAATRFVEERFLIHEGGGVERFVRRGTQKLDDWEDPVNVLSQTFNLTAGGITNVESSAPSRTSPSKTAAVKVSPVAAQIPGEPIAWWRFDEARGDATRESVGGHESAIAGHKSLWKPGVSGAALQFDGYNTEVRAPSKAIGKPTHALTVEAWVAVGAYPWNWTPLVQQTDDPPEVVVPERGGEAVLQGEEGRKEHEEPLESESQEEDEEEGDDEEEEDEDDEDEFSFVVLPEDDVGYYLGIDGLGRPGFKIRVGDRWRELVGPNVLERRRWHHVTGVYDGRSGQMRLFVNGKQAAELSTPGGELQLSSNDVILGKGKPRRPIRPVRANTFIDSYALDGLLDEVRIHNTALSSADIQTIYEQLRPDRSAVAAEPLQPRALPSGGNVGRFEARYHRLKFYDAWDNLWRFGDYPDVVVTFDRSPCRFVFWRGCGYIPMLVNDKGHWYSNEFNETWNKSGGQGCQEPMSDKESYSNHVRIIENTSARVVVHWRYPLLDVLHVAANYNPETGWADWADWYYYIYPDGVAAKRMHLWTDGERNHEWQESMAIMGPNQHPEEVLETSPAILLISERGEVTKYNWVNGPPDEIDVAEKQIQVVNYKSEYDPFTIGDFTEGDVYGGELTEYAVFPSWNHWPVAQMPSDGRYATYPDRTAHSSLTHVGLPTYREAFGDRPFEERILLEGMSKFDARELGQLARSWLDPPELTVSSGAKSSGYDPGQRAYLLKATDHSISLALNGSQKSPIFNPCFVLTNWDADSASVKATSHGKEIQCEVRIGEPRTVRTCDLVIWMEMRATSPIELTIRSE